MGISKETWNWFLLAPKSIWNSHLQFGLKRCGKSSVYPFPAPQHRLSCRWPVISNIPVVFKTYFITNNCPEIFNLKRTKIFYTPGPLVWLLFKGVLRLHMIMLCGVPMSTRYIHCHQTLMWWVSFSNFNALSSPSTSLVISNTRSLTDDWILTVNIFSMHKSPFVHHAANSGLIALNATQKRKRIR